MKEYCAVVFMLEHGSRWAIGNGEVVRIWKDRWLPRPLKFKILTPAPPALGELMVKNLISAKDMCSKIDLLHQLFAKEEVRYICSIPLNFQRLPDRLMWHYYEKGLFSVKSAYKVAITSDVAPVLLASSSSNNGGA